MRWVLMTTAVLMLAGCAGVDPLGSTDDMCRTSSRCAPTCGSVASGASGDCDPYQNGGRTRG